MCGCNCNHTKQGIIAFLSGAATGAIIALLFAPEKGEVTRRKIGETVEKGKDKLMDAVEHGKRKVESAFRSGKDRFEEMIHEGLEMTEEMLEEGRGIIDEKIANFCEAPKKK